MFNINITLIAVSFSFLVSGSESDLTCSAAMPTAEVKQVSVPCALQSTDTWSRYLHCGGRGSPP